MPISDQRLRPVLDQYTKPSNRRDQLVSDHGVLTVTGWQHDPSSLRRPRHVCDRPIETNLGSSLTVNTGGAKVRRLSVMTQSDRPLQGRLWNR